MPVARGPVEPYEQPVVRADAGTDPRQRGDLLDHRLRHRAPPVVTSSVSPAAGDLRDRSRLHQPAAVHDHQVRAGLLDLGEEVAGDDDGPARRPRTGSSRPASRGSAAGRVRSSARRGSAGPACRAWPARWRAAAACPASRCVPRGRARRRARRSPGPPRCARPRRGGRWPASTAPGCRGPTDAAGSPRPRRTRRPARAPARPGRMAWPKTRISPASGRISPISMRRVVVLPAPLGPSRPSTWPFSTRKDRSRTAYRSADLAYRLVRPVISSGTSASAGSGAGASAPAPGGEQQRRRDQRARGREPPGPPGQPAAWRLHGGRGGHGQGAAAAESDGVRGGRGRGRVAEVGGGRTSRSRCPASTSWSTAGRVSATSLPCSASSTRTGATSWEGSTCWRPSGPTSYTLPNRTASPLLEADLDADGRRAGDPQRLRQRRGVEAGVLAGEVEGEAEHRGRRAGRARRRGRGPRRWRAGWRRPGWRSVCSRPVSAIGCGAARQPGVAVAGRAAQQGLAVGGVDASGPADAEGGSGVRALVLLEVAVEPVADPALDPAGLPVAAVVAAGDPVDGDGRAVGADRLAMASACASGKSESVWPCTISAGTLMRSPTAEGLRRSRSCRAAASGFPATATRSYMAHSAGWKRPQPLGLAGPAAAAAPAAPAGRPGAARGRDPPGGCAGGLRRWARSSGGAHRPTGAGGEEDPGPELLEDAVREERVGEVPVGDRGGDGVDALVVSGGEQRDRPAVGGAGDADARIAVRVQLHLGPLRQPVDEPGDVLDLEVGVVEPDLPGGRAEAAGGPGQHGVSVAGQLLGLGAYVVLAAAEAVPEEHGGPALRAARREVGGVDLRPGHLLHPVLHGARRARRRQATAGPGARSRRGRRRRRRLRAIGRAAGGKSDLHA